MKLFIVICLCSLVFLQSCSSFYPLKKNEKGETEPIADCSIRIVLNDGSMIDCARSDHFYIESSADFIYGIGEQYDAGRGRTKSFHDKIVRSFIDSTEMIRDSTDESKNGMLTIWLNDGTLVRFRNQNYLNITPEQGTGYYCIGKMTNGDTVSQFAGKVDRKNIKEIKIKRTDTAASVLSLIGVTVGLFVAGGLLIVMRGGITGGCH